MFERGLMCFEVNHLSVDIHTHHAIQLVLTLDSSFHSTLGNDFFENIQGFLADSDLQHSCKSEKSNLLIFNFAPESLYGLKFKKRIPENNRYLLISDFLAQDQIEYIKGIYRNYKNNKIEFTFFLKKLEDFFNEHLHIEVKNEIDSRLFHIMQHIENHCNESLSITHLGKKIGLSQSRLRNIFLNEIGIPLTKYIQWTRVKMALRLVLIKGFNLTAAALESGFYDQSHFIRIFRKIFGIKPSVLFKNSQFIKSLLG